MDMLKGKFWHFIIGLILILVCLRLCCGCSSLEGFTVANPKATMEFDPLAGKFRMMSSRDDSGEIAEMELKVPPGCPTPLAGAEVKLKGAKFTSEASSVRKANAAQEEAYATQIEATGRAWERGINAAGGIAENFFGRWMPNTASEVIKLLTYLIGVPIAAVFGIAILLAGGLAVAFMVALAVYLWRKYRTKATD